MHTIIAVLACLLGLLGLATAAPAPAPEPLIINTILSSILSPAKTTSRTTTTPTVKTTTTKSGFNIPITGIFSTLLNPKTTTTTKTITTKTTSTTKAATATSTIPPASSISVGKVTYNGTGCPSGTASVLLSSDAQSFTILFSQYTASISASTASTVAASCTLSFALIPPSGYSYTIANVNYRGGIYLDSGVTASQTAIYSFTALGVIPVVTSIKTSTWRGPLDYKDYVVSDSVGFQTILYLDIQFGE
ncbi:hypothetical protein HDV00_007460 [Rhizophlyctis rosea]|nr:hypothetical protein HDV00_007460 [Rhizophlyctis rosea]